MFLWNSALEFIPPLQFLSSWYPPTGVHFKPVEMQEECFLIQLEIFLINHKIAISAPANRDEVSELQYIESIIL